MERLFEPQIAKLPRPTMGFAPTKLPMGTRRPGLEDARRTFIDIADQTLSRPYLQYFSPGSVLDAILPETHETDWMPTLVAALTKLEAFWQAAVDSTSDFAERFQACIEHFASWRERTGSAR